MRLTPADKLCVPVPLYHCFGLVLGNLACITHGSSIVYPSLGFEADAVLKAVHNEKCTALHGVPTMFINELDHPNFSHYDLSSLRTGIMAGAPCPHEVMKRVMGDMHMSEVTIGYGMTETSPISFQTAFDDPVEARVETVGRVFPHVECKVVDAAGESSEPLPVGQSGELMTKGYLVMKGYWNQPDATAKAIDKDGFMHTGDLATIDELGYCRIVGRIKDMIIRGGENIYPRELEEVLYQHPDIGDVSVVGVPDEKWGERVVAWVIPKSKDRPVTCSQLRTFLKDRVAHYKLPSHVFCVDSLPLTVTGKIQKFQIRDQTVAWLKQHGNSHGTH
eukprot:TRINITY_DN1727_c0_g1_i1.p1 TRINITY_DN1727_c0_g1~~TRINITY_DN1727_c0_g1_i1.p1  ORF type:complete len:333 (-),score=55.60 TRINITY_DN1727_c0_g1_i1:627-1625(-)